jgi:hypothetical protein
MKTKNQKTKTAPVGPATEQANAARAAREAIQKDPNAPENYTALAGALRMLAQFLRVRNPVAADNLLHLACAAAWEAKRRSTPALISGRTKQEVKILTAWVRMREHLAPEESETRMEQICGQYLAEAVRDSESVHALADSHLE